MSSGPLFKVNTFGYDMFKLMRNYDFFQDVLVTMVDRVVRKGSLKPDNFIKVNVFNKEFFFNTKPFTFTFLYKKVNNFDYLLANPYVANRVLDNKFSKFFNFFVSFDLLGKDINFTFNKILLFDNLFMSDDYKSFLYAHKQDVFITNSFVKLVTENINLNLFFDMYVDVLNFRDNVRRSYMKYRGFFNFYHGYDPAIGSLGFSKLFYNSAYKAFKGKRNFSRIIRSKSLNDFLMFNLNEDSSLELKKLHRGGFYNLKGDLLSRRTKQMFFGYNIHNKGWRGFIENFFDDIFFDTMHELKELDFFANEALATEESGYYITGEENTQLMFEGKGTRQLKLDSLDNDASRKEYDDSVHNFMSNDLVDDSPVLVASPYLPDMLHSRSIDGDSFLETYVIDSDNFLEDSLLAGGLKAVNRSPAFVESYPKPNFLLDFDVYYSPRMLDS